MTNFALLLYIIDRVHWAKEKGDPPVFSLKASISHGIGVHKRKRYGQFACFGRQIEC